MNEILLAIGYWHIIGYISLKSLSELMMNKIVIASILLLFCICLVECEEERKCLMCHKHKRTDKAVKVSSIKAGEAFPLKDGEGAIIEEKGTILESYTAFGDKKIFQYEHGKMGSMESIEYISATVTVEKGKNYNFYDVKNAKIDEGESYVWLNDRAAYRCEIEPGKYSINDFNSKCESDKISLDLDSYVFKTTEDGKEAYATYSTSMVGHINEYSKYEVKTFAELNEIMSKYPKEKSSSVIIPSVMMVLALLFLLM